MFVTCDLDGEKKAFESKDAKVPEIKRITANRKENMRSRIIFPDAATALRVPNGQQRWPVNCHQKPAARAHAPPPNTHPGCPASPSPTRSSSSA